MAETKPTAEQDLAITTLDRTLAVEAGAGSGKTWVLTRRFLHLLETRPAWPLESILAVTFTEKAAREMRTRIRSAVEARAAAVELGASLELAPPVAALVSQSKTPSGACPEERGDGDSGADSALWQTRRAELDRLQVSTIHSLCARLLHEHAIAAGLDPQFAVLDEQEAQLLKEEALRQAIGELAAEREGAAAPGLELLATWGAGDLLAQLASLLEQRGVVRRIFAELPDAPGLLQRWKAGLEALRRQLWQGQLRAAPGLEAAIARLPEVATRDENDKLAPALSLAQQGCAAYQAGRLAEALSAWSQMKNVHVGKEGSWGGKEALAALRADLRMLKDAAEFLAAAGCAAEPGAEDAAAAGDLQLWRSLWEALEAAYTRLKDARGALDFDDLELYAEALLCDPQRDLRLQFALDGVRHLMIDEFQDTNAIQQRLLTAIAPLADPGRLFVVGDAKQSIYRFRQAQVSVFNRTVAEITDLTGCRPSALSCSFRSHAGLVSLLNDLFGRVLQPSGEAYADYEARPGPLSAARPAPPPHPGLPAPVEILLTPGEDAQGEKLDAEAVRLLEAHLLAERLISLQQDQAPVWDHHLEAYRPFQFGDAAILFRATTQLPVYEEVFKAEGLPYLTAGGRGFYDRPEVSDLIALLAALYNPADELSLATVLRSPFFTLSDESLYRLRRSPSPGAPAAAGPMPLRDALRGAQQQPDAYPGQEAAVARAGRVLEALWALAGRVEVITLLRRALYLSGYEAALALADREASGSGRPLRNVRKLLELARARRGASLPDFLAAIQDLKAREAREGEALGSPPHSGSVQLLSIHAAKGLEFPVVAVADLGRQERHGAPPRLLFDPEFGLVCKRRDPHTGEWLAPASYRWGAWQAGRMEQAESRRLLYVACTRAADLLILSGRPGTGANWLKEILALWELASAGPPDETVARAGVPLRVLRAF